MQKERNVFYRFEELKNSEAKRNIGKKALSLIELTEMGLPVPGGGVITTEGLSRFLEATGLAEGADHSTYFYYHVRRFTLALIPHLREMKVVGEEEKDIFFLEKDHLIKIIRADMTPEEARKILARNKQYYFSFRNYQNPNEIGSRFGGREEVEVDGLTQTFRGVAGSPGVVVGKVKVIQDIFDADRLEKGDILITKFTDPGWTPKFGLINGVATETGGLLSHAAVISREYGIPAVLAVPHLTRHLQDGQTVRIDGNRGTVEIVDENGPLT